MNKQSKSETKMIPTIVIETTFEELVKFMSTLPYEPKKHPVTLTEDDVSELKTLLNGIEQEEFHRRATRTTTSDRERELLKQSLLRILSQIPRT